MVKTWKFNSRTVNLGPFFWPVSYGNSKLKGICPLKSQMSKLRVSIYLFDHVYVLLGLKLMEWELSASFIMSLSGNLEAVQGSSGTQSA